LGENNNSGETAHSASQTISDLQQNKQIKNTKKQRELNGQAHQAF